MSTPDDSVLLNQLAEEYTARVRGGELPDLDEYARRHPPLAERIRALFPTLLFLEGLAGAGVHEAATVAPGSRLAELTPGQMFNHYRIERELGRGGMGVVYEAIHVPLGKRVALKVLSLGTAPGSAGLERFLREAQTAAGLHHTNIVPVFDIGQANGLPYYAMQFIEGRGLDRLLQEKAGPSGGEYMRWVAELGAQAAEGLAYAHQRGVIHRDIKPSNLLLDGQGVLWITDFGLARRADDPSLTQSGALVGTPRYMSPEQAEAARRPVDHRTDIYSLGATLYELVTRRAPFTGDTPVDILLQILERDPVAPRRLEPTVPRDLETVILKAMAKRPEDRYATAAELAEDLRRWLNDEPIQARRIGLAGRAVRWWRRNPKLASTISLFSFLLLVLSATYLKGLRRQTVEMQKLANRASAESRKATSSRRTAEQERDRAQDHLCRALYEQGRTVLASNEFGRRWKALELVGKSEKLRSRKGRRVEPDGLPTQTDLRSLAVSSLLLRDARVTREWPGLPFGIAPSGRRILVLGLDNASKDQLVLVDLDTRREQVFPFTPPTGTSFKDQVALSPDGTRIATYGADGFGVYVSDLSQGGFQRLADMPAIPDKTSGSTAAPRECRDLHFHPDGKKVLGLRPLGQSRVQVLKWDLETRADPQVLLEDSPPEATKFLLSPTGRWLTWFPCRPLVLWDLHNSRKIGPLPLVTGKNAGEVHTLAFAPQEDVLAYVCQSDAKRSTIILWDLAQQRELGRIVPQGQAISSVVFSPDGRQLLASDENRLAQVFSVADRREDFRLSMPAIALDWQPNKHQLLTVDLSAVKLWEIDWDTAVSSVGLGLEPTRILTISPNSEWVAVGNHHDGRVRLVNRLTQAIRHLDFQLLPDQVEFHPDNRSAGVRHAQECELINLDTGQSLTRLKSPSKERRFISGVFNADGHFLVIHKLPRQEGGEELCVWNVTTGKPLWTLPVSAHFASFSLRGAFVVTHPSWHEWFLPPRTEGKDIAVWDLAARRRVGDGHLAAGKTEQFGSSRTSGTRPMVSPNGQWLVTTLTTLFKKLEHRALVWRFPDEKKHFGIQGPDEISAYSFSSDSRLLAVGYKNGVAQLWDLPRAEQLFEWKPHAKMIQHLVFTPDGKFLASNQSESSDLQLLDLAQLRRQLAEVGLDW